MYDEYHFVVDEDDFEDMIGEKWTYVSEGGSWRADFDDESVEAEEGYYEISIHADLFYKIRGDKVDCYLTIWTKYESSLAED